MHRRTFLQSASFALLTATTSVNSRADETASDLDERLEKIRSDHQIPGIAGAVIEGDKIVAQGVAGVREVGGEAKIEPGDRFLIGSCTKRMTATMIGRLIDKDTLSFETPLAKALPDINMRDEYRDVTIAQLLTFRGGIAPYTRVGPTESALLSSFKGSAAEQREQFVEHVLQEEPVAKPGTESVYSNASYVVAAFVAARKTGHPWEDLMREHIFKPLGMTNSGFGAPWSKETPNQPRGHRKTNRGYVPADESPDRRLVMAGPGGVHCSIADLARFAIYELQAAQGRDSLLREETSQRWRELSQRDDAGPRRIRREPAEGSPRRPQIRRNRLSGRAVRGASQAISAAYILWPETNRAAAAAVNAGMAFPACEAFFETVAKG